MDEEEPSLFIIGISVSDHRVFCFWHDEVCSIGGQRDGNLAKTKNHFKSFIYFFFFFYG